MSDRNHTTETTTENRIDRSAQSYDQLYPSRFMNAGLLQGRTVTLTISDVYREDLDCDGKLRVVFSFAETLRQLVVCKTNGALVAACLGINVRDWVGKQITLGPDTWRGEPCIRVVGSPHLAEDREITIELNTPTKKKQKLRRKLTKTGATK